MELRTGSSTDSAVGQYARYAGSELRTMGSSSLRLQQQIVVLTRASLPMFVTTD
jgi:hypothetical protein